MPQVDRTIIKDRARRLRAAGEAAYRRHLAGEIGATRAVLVERAGLGRTEQFTETELTVGAPGDVVPVRIVGHTMRHLVAEAA